MLQRDLEQLSLLSKNIKAYDCVIRAKAALPDQLEVSVGGTLAESLDDFDTSVVESHKFVDFPPKPRSTPCKPTLFDLATLEYPSIEARKKPARGFFSSLLGR